MKIFLSQSKRFLAILVAFTVLGSNLSPAAIALEDLAPNFSVGTVGAVIDSAKSLSVGNMKKENLSEPKKKLGTDLLKLIDDSFLLPNQNRSQLISQMKVSKQFIAKTDSVKTISKRIINKKHNDLVYVYVSLNSRVRTPAISPFVWKIVDRDEENHLAVALVEVDKLETLASLNGVRSVSSVLPPVTRSGSVVAEGDIIHQTGDVRSIYSQGGAGMKIGVISDGVDNIASAKSTGDLPAEVTVLDNSVGGDEGTAMLEIIHDMVPNAQLFFHTGFPNSVVFNDAVDDLVTAGVNVIVDDLGFFDQPFFEDGTIASHVTSVLSANNIVYVSATGNDAQKHYQGDYYNDGIDFHDFSRNPSTNDYLYLEIPNNGGVTVFLQWNDNFGSSGNDYDLYLFNMDGWDVLASSGNPQNGTSDPIEILSYTNTTGSTITAQIDVRNYQGLATTKTLELFISTSYGAWNYSNNITPVDSIFGHPAVPEVIAVGAINANDPGNDTIEYFSSQGPVTIIGQAQRVKPDVTGIDNVSVTGAGGFGSPFSGTSAAAPAVAAIVAQLWAQYPLATGNQIKNHILNSAVDLGTTGNDSVFGHGRADSWLAFQSAPAITSFDFTDLDPQITGVIDDTNHTVALTVPTGTNVTALFPTIAFTGSSVNPTSGSAQNFTNPVTYTVTTTSGLSQAYVVTVTVTPAATHTISGTIKYYDGVKAVPDATVILEDAIGTQLATTTTNTSGAYQFTGVAGGEDYVVRVSKSDGSSGLSSADQTKIRRHIVNIGLLDLIYKIIAGDVNNSGGLSSADQTKIRRFIIGLDSNLPSGAWKFYPTSAVLDTTNYLTATQTRTYTDLSADTSSQDFTGIKMGDVNNSW